MTDQLNAARTPRETSVSMLVEPCRRLRQAALWNGSAAQKTTGSDSATSSHSQPGNRIRGVRASTIATSPSGTVRNAATISRLRSIRTRSSAAVDSSPSRTSAAPYPAFSTVAIASSARAGSRPVTTARSVA
ncbi:hypothetical protein SDC9_122457 [bioreactor metagenome]|uniref:Uncharacterized protein n=1 Tax=bioreactor metagenome TaxID=1076179 RepID=A0A645CEW9_9ZZZZ